MKRTSILILILSAYFVTAAWAQQPAAQPPIGTHLQHRMANQTSRTPGLRVSPSFHAQANPDHAAKVWELGTYPGNPGGTWFETLSVNDFGVLVGFGDIPPAGSDGFGYTHTLAVPLFGPRAGEWIDLGTLGGPKGWEEGASISDTGLVTSHSTAQDGQQHGAVWTKETGWVDLGTLADTGDPRYTSYNSSNATGLNKLGTLIPGWSGADGTPETPVAWTPSREWKNGQFVTKWKIHKLDTTALPDLPFWNVWNANDYGQMIGTGWKSDGTAETAVLWNRRADGKGWRLMSLPSAPAYPFTQAYNINDRGEIVGVVSPPDWSATLPVLWKPLDRKRTTYSQPIMLPQPKGGFADCYCVGINDLGDMVGDCWDEAYTMDLPTRWITKDLTFSELIDFPADWGFAWGVNNNRIAAVTYTGGEKCSAGVPWTYTCGGAIQLH